MNDEPYDVAVLGSGPAGLQAAVHAGRRKARVLVLGRAEKSGCWKAHVDNLVGAGRTTGAELVRTGREQAASAGAELREEDVTKLGTGDEGFIVTCESGDKLGARALVIATGVSRAKLGAPGEKDFVGKGVSYCVDCDAGFFKGKPVAVTGEGSAAAEGALLMLKYATEVHLVTRGLECAEKLKAEVASSAVVEHSPDGIVKIVGAEGVEAVELESGEHLEVNGVFIELGAKGVMELTMDLGIELDPESFKYVVVDRRQRTNVAGVFAAGDITGPPWQIAKALGEGCVAGLEAAAFAKKVGT
ncbi:MAG: NAD(P)/FAD-dependent oxidoreductase [Planctomycetota bacterium]|jgi:thioredoxin reductase (NADPH)